MESDFLLEIIHNNLWRANVEELAKFVVHEQFSLRELIDLTFHPKEQIGFKAAWNLENVYFYHRALFLKDAVYFLNSFSVQQNPSARRHFLRILCFMTAKKATSAEKEIIDAYETSELVETIFGWLIEEKMAVAVKVFAITSLANLAVKHDWIKDELLQTIDYLVDKESIAFFARAKQIRKQLASS